MRTPLRQKVRVPRAQSSVVQSYPAPVGGWNARDAYAAMEPTDAITLTNWFPRPSYCEMRGGCSQWATGLAFPGKTLAVYNKLNGTSQMFAATSANVWNVSTQGIASSVAGRTSGKHQWTNFGDGTSNYLIMCNGVDKPLYYDGTTWTAVDNATSPALTGVTSSNLVAPGVFKGRLLFLEVNSLSFWYLAAGAAGGALTEFPLDGEATRGGYLMAYGAWTVDAGNGPDDRAVFVTSEGEIIVYAGTNPSSAATWTKVGSYYIGKPLGRRCLVKYGGDLVLLTQNGAFPLSTALQSATIDYKTALSDKIINAFTTAARNYGSNFGWTAIVLPSQAAFIVNIPIAEDGEHEQYVMSTLTKGWCNFDSWDAEDFVVFNNELYFTSGAVVYKAWTGTSDNGSNIVATGKTAFSYFRRPDSMKLFTLFRPVLATNGQVTFLTGIDIDFQDRPITATATYTPVTSAVWGSALWGTAVWASGLEVVKRWTSPSSYMGYCAAGKVKIATTTLSIQWMANDYVFEVGSPVG